MGLLLNWLIGGSAAARPSYRARPDSAEGVSGFLIGDGQFGFHVVGTSNHQAMLKKLNHGPHHQSAHALCHAILRPEPTNPYDRNAVAIYVDEWPIGYLDRPSAKEFNAELARAGCAEAYCEAKIVGGWDRGEGNKGSFGVRLNACLPFRIVPK